MKLICLLFLVSIVASCNKDPEYYTLETPADQMLLKASSTELTLEKEKENETAVTFTWNAAAQRGGADASIAYTPMSLAYMKLKPENALSASRIMN